MKIFFLRLLIIFTISFLEYSFFDIVFPWVEAPVILLVSIVSWTLIVGFPKSLTVVLPLAVVFDIASSGMLGYFTLYAALLSYVTSFLSRRLLFEQRGIGLFSYAFFAAGSVLGSVLFEYLFSYGVFSHVTLATDTGILLTRIFSSTLFFSSLFAIPIFLCSYWCIKEFEKYVESLYRGEFSKVR